MGILVAPRATAEFEQNPTAFANWLRGSVEEPDSGISVNARTAVRNVTILKCVLWRANQVGMLPWKVKERVQVLGRSAEVDAPRHPLYRIVHTNPNPTITAKAHWGLVSADLHLWGNSYAYQERGSNTGRLVNLWRFQPHQVTLEKNLTYTVTDDEGHRENFSPDEIFHVKGLGYDGLRGYSPITLARQAIGWNEATQRYGAQFFKNASRPSGLLISPQVLKPEQKAALIQNLKAGGRDAGTLKLIEGALEYKPLSMPQDDAQFIETMQYQEEYLIGLMCVPQHKVQVLRRSTNNNIEHQGIEAVTDSIQPCVVEIEQAADLQLLSDFPGSGRGGGTERDRFLVEAELKALMRGDTAAQTAHIEKMIDKGVYSQNDARDYLGLPPVDGGDTYWMNLAYGPIDQIRDLLTAEAEGADTPAGGENASAKLVLEAQARYAKSYAHVFRDAAGRALSRPVKDRERSVPALFRATLIALADGIGLSLDEDFVSGYLAALGKRSVDWENADTVAASELDRAVKSILERGQR